MNTPLNDEEVIRYRLINEGQEPRLFDEAVWFVQHRTVPFGMKDGHQTGGWSCDGRVKDDGYCACGADALLEGIRKRNLKRVGPSVPLTPYEERIAVRRNRVVRPAQGDTE